MAPGPVPIAGSGADPLSRWLEERLGVRPVRRRPVGGGCIHSAWCVTLAEGGSLFVKTNRADALSLLEGEADGLAALGATAQAAEAAGLPSLRVPEPLALGLAGDQAVLVLPWLAFGDAAGAAGWRNLGAALAGLHRRSLDQAEGAAPLRFGWGCDNHIGAFPQRNGWCESWPRFFARRRLAPQLEALAAAGQPLRSGKELPDLAEELLAAHHPDPCLVHGDLWSGNAALLAGGGGAIFDPAVHRADREVDLAMARLFGGFPAQFFAGYEAAWPLPPDHGARRDLYNLYHLLNHANLFGGGYLSQVEAGVQALLRSR
jgi:hypothetical protein